MAVKGLGVAIKVTLSGNNQLWRPGTWVFAFTVAFAIAVQMNFFNKVSAGFCLVSSRCWPKMLTRNLACRLWTCFLRRECFQASSSL